MKPLALLWIAVVAAALLTLGLRLHAGFPVETRILSMLPPNEGDPVLAAAEARLSQTTTRRLLVLAGHAEPKAARAAADALQIALSAQGMARPLALGVAPADIDPLLRALSAHAPGLLTDRDRADLMAGQGSAVAGRALARVAVPLQVASAPVLAADPLLSSVAFLGDLPRPPSKLAPVDGRLEGRDGDRHVVLSILQLAGDPFAAPTQGPLIDALTRERARLEAAAPGLSIQAAGAVLYAAAGSRDALADVSRIGIIDTVAAVVLLLLAFRGIGALALIAVPVLVGIVMGGTAVALAFPAVHGLALIFGTTLIGTAVDYAIHYVSGRYAAADPMARLRLVRMGTFLGLITTVIGYLAMLPSPFPALQELALFSAVGLTAAWITVVLWLPYLDRSPRLSPPPGLNSAFSWTASHARPLTWIGCGALLILTLWGATRLTISDDIRRFQSLPADLRQEEAAIRRAGGIELVPLVLAVSAADDEAALQIGEAVQARLLAAGVMAESVSRYLPSAARQRENVDLVKAHLPIDRLGPLAPALSRRLNAPIEPLRIDALPPPLSARVADLRTTGADGRVVHMIHVFDPQAKAAVQAAIAGIAGVQLVDIPARISAGFAQQRLHTLGLLAGLIVVTFVIATFRYGWRRGLMTTAVPAVATLATPPLLALIGEPFSFFDAIGLLLVVALGVDYAFYWSEAEPDHKPYTALAVIVSMLMTVVTFGLLVLSRTEALASFGATVALGTLLSALLAPLSGRRAA